MPSVRDIDSVRAAITLSDNNAAELMFATVGPEPVDTVLAEAGLDAAVNTVKVRPEFSTFGQTALGVADEAALADHLACLSGAADVLSLMGQVDASQAYGLGSVGALFKGGWGPDAAGMYQVRQLGLMPRGDGTFAPVALTALPADGSYATGQAMLNAAAQQLAANAVRYSDDGTRIWFGVDQVLGPEGPEIQYQDTVDLTPLPGFDDASAAARGEGSGESEEPAKPARKSARSKSKRASMPSWDEIVFGSRND